MVGRDGEEEGGDRGVEGGEVGTALMVIIVMGEGVGGGVD